MPITGRVPLKKWQAAIEAPTGTIKAATRVQPLLSGDLVQHMEREYPQEQRGSLIKNYGNDYQFKHFVELQGLTAVPTYEDLPWFLQGFARGSVAGSPTAVTAYSYVFGPTGVAASSNTLQSVTWEVAGDTQTYAVPYAIGTRFRIEGGVGKPASMTVDYLGQRAVAQALTSNLSLRTVEVINTATAVAYIDSTTIGTTQVYNVLDFSFELPTGQKQFWALDGNKYPRDAYRGETVAASFEATLAFTDTTEYVAFTGDTDRKIRLVVNGSSIAGSSPATTKSLTIDWYGPWSEAPFGEQDGLVVIKVKGESVYDTTLGGDWRVAVVNDLSTLP